MTRAAVSLTALAGLIAGLTAFGAPAQAARSGHAPPAAASAEDSISQQKVIDARVSATVTSDGSSDPTGKVEADIEVICWWDPTPYDIDGRNKGAMLRWYDYLLHYGPPEEVYANFPKRELFVDAMNDPKYEDHAWYYLDCQEDVTPEEKLEYSPWQRDGRHMALVLFSSSDPPPPPRVDPEEVALWAHEQMVIEAPEVDYNPKVGPAGATLVGFPTWFWVTNPESVGGDDGERWMKVEIDGTPVEATVTAQTEGLSMSAVGADGVQCDPDRARLKWAPGAEGGCALAFPRASVGMPSGYPVAATAAWDVEWAGVNQDGEPVGDSMEPFEETGELGIPVAEVQTIVR